MKLQWHLSFATMCLYVWGGIFPSDHHKERNNNCEGHFYKGWTHLQLLLKKASLDFCCKCNEEKCISIAIFPASKHVPVFWAYKIRHAEVSDVTEQDLLKNIATWYTPASVIENMLRGELHSLPPQTTARPSSSTTHILSGVFNINAKHIHKEGNWHNTGYIHWITYHHTSVKGLSFEGAFVQKNQEKCKWKRLTVEQLVGILSKVFLANLMQTSFTGQIAGPLILNGLDKILDNFSIGAKVKDDLNSAMPCVTTTTMLVKEAEHDISKVTSSSKPPFSAGMCSVLIHRTSTGLKRCLERMILEKANYTTPSTLSHFSAINT